MKKRIFIVIICFFVAFIAVLFLIKKSHNDNSFSASAQELQENAFTIHPYVTGFQAHNYFYSCGFALPGQNGNHSEHTRFSWSTYSDYTIDPLKYWSMSGGRGLLINTGLLGLSGESIVGISIDAFDLQDNVAMLSFLGNINLPGWDIEHQTENTSNVIYAPTFLSLNNRSPEQFFDNVIFSFTSDGLRYDFSVPYVVGDAIVVKHSFSLPHYIRFITLYTDTSEYQLGYQNGYEQGLLDGYESGYTQGHAEGYQEGYSAGLSGTINTNWFTSFIDSIFNIFDVEIFPNVKLIYLIFIPIGFGILFLILKLIRG